MPASRQPIAAKSHPTPQTPSPALARKPIALAFLWGVVALLYAGLAWQYGFRVAWITYSSATFDHHVLWDVGTFAIGFALVAVGALACAVGALLNRWYYREFHMDKIWMIAALLATVSFATPLFMPDTMKPRLGVERMFSLYGAAEVVQVIALMFLLAVFAVPFQKREANGT
jgi:hypothetical protein